MKHALLIITIVSLTACGNYPGITDMRMTLAGDGSCQIVRVSAVTDAQGIFRNKLNPLPLEFTENGTYTLGRWADPKAQTSVMKADCLVNGNVVSSPNFDLIHEANQTLDPVVITASNQVLK